ncbi:MAG: hypothetical protein NTX49_03100 [Chlamydiae bacterium]|nr:hypothetical protein [Chlamydiota bacterium]
MDINLNVKTLMEADFNSTVIYKKSDGNLGTCSKGFLGKLWLCLTGNAANAKCDIVATAINNLVKTKGLELGERDKPNLRAKLVELNEHFENKIGQRGDTAVRTIREAIGSLRSSSQGSPSEVQQVVVPNQGGAPQQMMTRQEVLRLRRNIASTPLTAAYQPPVTQAEGPVTAPAQPPMPTGKQISAAPLPVPPAFCGTPEERARAQGLARVLGLSSESIDETAERTTIERVDVPVDLRDSAPSEAVFGQPKYTGRTVAGGIVVRHNFNPMAGVLAQRARVMGKH